MLSFVRAFSSGRRQCGRGLCAPMSATKKKGSSSHRVSPHTGGSHISHSPISYLVAQPFARQLDENILEGRAVEMHVFQLESLRLDPFDQLDECLRRPAGT